LLARIDPNFEGVFIVMRDGKISNYCDLEEEDELSLYKERTTSQTVSENHD